MQTLVVTRVEPRDWQRQREVRLAALADSPAMFGSTLARELAFEDDEWHRRAARPTTFLASRDGVDVGMAGVYELDVGWCVMGMWIVPAARGTGIVEALLGACESVAREAGADTVALGVMEDNPRGRRAYERAGYRYTGEREHIRDGRDELFMRKDLRPSRDDGRRAARPAAVSWQPIPSWNTWLIHRPRATTDPGGELATEPVAEHVADSPLVGRRALR